MCFILKIVSVQKELGIASPIGFLCNEVREVQTAFRQEDCLRRADAEPLLRDEASV